MNCEILETLYLRSNGDVPCNDDAGENVLLGIFRSQKTSCSATSLFNNHRYRHIRDALRRGEPPWPRFCRECAFFRPDQPFSDSLAEKRIRKIQVEPSLTCQLRCPGCSNRYQVRVRPPPLQMDVTLFTRILEGIRAEGYAVGEIEYCGQGEPLLHPHFPEFVRIARAHFPGTPQRLITHGNFDFAATAGREPLDEIIVSCDGLFPESYSRYRIGGDIASALEFIRAARSQQARLILIWKYILFEWNDSRDELLAAQRTADSIGVDYLLFVFTHSAGKSLRYSMENATELPIESPRVVIGATPRHYRSGRTGAGANEPK